MGADHHDRRNAADRAGAGPWGWVAGPALALLLDRVTPLSAAHAAGLVLISLAPMTPAYPIMVSKARGDMSAAGAFTLVATVATVLLLRRASPGDGNGGA